MTDKSDSSGGSWSQKEPRVVGNTTIHPSGMTADGKKKPPLSMVIMNWGGRPPFRKPKNE